MRTSKTGGFLVIGLLTALPCGCKKAEPAPVDAHAASCKCPGGDAAACACGECAQGKECTCEHK